MALYSAGQKNGIKMPPGRQTWLYHKEELENTPSRREGMPQEEERAVRKSTCQFIQKVATNTRIPCKALAVWTAKVQPIVHAARTIKVVPLACMPCKRENDDWGEGEREREGGRAREGGRGDMLVKRREGRAG